MDPDAALANARQAKADGNLIEAKTIHMDLGRWVANGGFEPSDPNWRSV